MNKRLGGHLWNSRTIVDSVCTCAVVCTCLLVDVWLSAIYLYIYLFFYPYGNFTLLESEIEWWVCAPRCLVW